MKTILMLLLGGIAGFVLHALTMKISFKQRTIDNKIKVYDAIIAQWVRMRNFVYNSLHNKSRVNIQERRDEFDNMYGVSQTFIGEAILVSDDEKLTDEINELNERMYRTDWLTMSDMANSLDTVNKTMEEIKSDAWGIIKSMRSDIKKSTRFEREDFVHIFKGIWSRKKRAK